MITWVTWIACIVGAYVVGSIPFGVIIGRARGVDIREHGSRNVGATNVGRVLGRKLGMLCFLLDVAKGVGPVLAAGFMTGVINRQPVPGELTPPEMWWWLAVAVATVIGHVSSIFLRFTGGKGVATGFGAMLAMWPLLTFPALGAMAVWYATLRFTRYVSVSSMLGAISLPVWYAIRVIPPTGNDVLPALTHASPPLVVTTLLAAFVVWRHRTNVARIRRGEEPKIQSTPK